MNIARNLHHALTSKLFALDEFDERIIYAIAGEMTRDCREILYYQLSMFNKCQDSFNDDGTCMRRCFYWMFFGKSVRDFQLRFNYLDEDQVLASLVVLHGDKQIIRCVLRMVNGVFFCIDYVVNDRDADFRPKTPNFEIEDIQVYV